jgi:hypothetical protein
MAQTPAPLIIGQWQPPVTLVLGADPSYPDLCFGDSKVAAPTGYVAVSSGHIFYDQNGHLQPGQVAQNRPFDDEWIDWIVGGYAELPGTMHWSVTWVSASLVHVSGDTSPV